MDIKTFTAEKTGNLLEIHGPFGQDWAFVPADLPPEWAFPARLWPLLDEATSAIMRLDGAGRHMQNPNLILRPLQAREALASSILEGTTAEPEDVLLFEKTPSAAHSDSEKQNEWREVVNYNAALKQGFNLLARGHPLNCEMIRQLHKTLMTGVRGKDKQPGEFREVQVRIGSSSRFIPPPPKHMLKCLQELETALNCDAAPYHALVWCYLVHYQFEAIHPFRDGNGRIGRVLLSLMTFQSLGLELPWLYMSPFYEEYKHQYVESLFGCSTEGAWERWIEFSLNGTLQQAKDSIIRLDLLVNLLHEYHHTLGGSGSRFHRIIDELFVSPIITVPDVVKMFGVTWPTAKSDIDTMVERGVLEKMSRPSRPRAYRAPRIFRIAYDGLDDLLAADFGDSG